MCVGVTVVSASRSGDTHETCIVPLRKVPRFPFPSFRAIAPSVRVAPQNVSNVSTCISCWWTRSEGREADPRRSSLFSSDEPTLIIFAANMRVCLYNTGVRIFVLRRTIQYGTGFWKNDQNRGGGLICMVGTVRWTQSQDTAEGARRSPSGVSHNLPAARFASRSLHITGTTEEKLS